MRVTDLMLQRTLLAGNQRAREQLFRIQEQAASGLRINRPSDDPVGAGQAVALRSQIEEQGVRFFTPPDLLIIGLEHRQGHTVLVLFDPHYEVGLDLCFIGFYDFSDFFRTGTVNADITDHKQFTVSAGAYFFSMRRFPAVKQGGIHRIFARIVAKGIAFGPPG